MRLVVLRKWTRIYHFINFATATCPTTARSAAKQILASPSVRSEFRYFGRAFAAFFPISGPRVEIQLVGALVQVILNADFMDKKRVDVAVRDQKSVSGRVWARIVHSRPSRETPALDADAEAAARLV